MPNANTSSLPDRAPTPPAVYAAIASISAGAIGFLVWLIYFNRFEIEGYRELASVLPAVNATLNAMSTVCLVSGYVAIRRKRRGVHKGLMLSAFACSTLFLISYIAYHSVQGDTKFLGTGWIRPAYFFILISHILCTLFALPLILTTFYFALTERFERHRKIAKVTLPLWLYVSVTGVAIFFLLRAHS
ncbi:MAG: DUF420 domain-containing protein [Candidatus Hydrogenedentes bacterium]|nr:DUF420 domain-containing protein [Candidatus Hydrogenedentota bacterium]